MHGYGKIVWTKDPFNGDEFYGQFRDGKTQIEDAASATKGAA